MNRGGVECLQNNYFGTWLRCNGVERKQMQTDQDYGRRRLDKLNEDPNTTCSL